MTDYDLIAQRAMRTVEICERVRIIESGMWLPVQMLYELMVKRKEITPISQEPKKATYWKEVSEAQPEESKIKKIWRAQALYMYDLIKENETESKG